MRSLFLALVFANLVFYAWSQGYLGSRDEGREPGRLAAQISPERLSLTRPGEAPPVAAPAAALPSCLLTAPLVIAEAERLKGVFETMGGAQVAVQPEAESSYWVHIPPQGNRAAAEKKTAELKRLGITDFFIVVEPGAGLNAISLGLFRKEELAREHLQHLTEMGVKSARIEARDRPAEQARLEIRGAADVLARLIKASAAEAGECPKP